MKMKYFLAALLLVPSLTMSATAQARTKETSALPRAKCGLHDGPWPKRMR